MRFILISLLLTGCSTYDIPATEYNDPIMLYPKVVKNGIQYIKDSSRGVFYSTVDGYESHYEIVDDMRDLRQARIFARYTCEELHKQECVLIAVNDRIEYRGVVIIAGKSYRYGERVNIFTSPELRSIAFSDARDELTPNLPDIFGDLEDQ